MIEGKRGSLGTYGAESRCGPHGEFCANQASIFRGFGSPRIVSATRGRFDTARSARLLNHRDLQGPMESGASSRASIPVFIAVPAP
jgi:hypothetical protein